MPNALQKFLALLFVVCVNVLLQIGVMIYGWGVHPQSWKWIIGVGLFGIAFTRLVGDVITKDK